MLGFWLEKQWICDYYEANWKLSNIISPSKTAGSPHSTYEQTRKRYLFLHLSPPTYFLISHSPLRNTTPLHRLYIRVTPMCVCHPNLSWTLPYICDCLLLNKSMWKSLEALQTCSPISVNRVTATWVPTIKLRVILCSRPHFGATCTKSCPFDLRNLSQMQPHCQWLFRPSSPARTIAAVS